MQVQLYSKAVLAGAALSAGAVAAGWAAWERDSAQGWLRWMLVGLAVTGAAALVLWGLLGPGARWLAGERRELTPLERGRLSVAERVEAINQARQALMQAVTGLVVIGGVVFTAAGLVYTSKTLETNQQGQVTDRYTKAIEQLGSDKSEVRLGGIYALGRLMIDSPRDDQTILEVLAAYVRTHAQDPSPIGSDKGRLAVDVEAALDVAARYRGSQNTFDLSNVDLHNRDMDNADLHGANLRGADLRGADLSDVNLLGTDLSGGNLSGGELSKADLSRAGLRGANLRGANLAGANLRGTDLRGADLRSVRGVTTDSVRQWALTDPTTKF